VLGLTAAASLTAALTPAPAARAHSVPQVQTTKYLAPETLAAILRRAALGQQVLVEGDIVSWIIQFTPVENDATVGVAGYVTDYLPPNVEVVGASIVIPDGNGGFREVAPNLPGLIRNGWGRNEERWLTPFNTAAYDPSGQCAAANETNKCDGSIAMSYADTGIFYSTDARTAVFASGAERVKQGTNGYKINPTGAGQINPTFGQTQATTHNLWDADQTNAFGSIQSAINALSAPKSAAASVTVTAKGPMPFNAGSAVAGPDSGYKLDNTGNVGPWRRVAYAGSRVGNTDEGPATSATKSRFGQSGNLVVGGPTDGGFALSTDSPLPVATNAVRFAVGRLQVGELRYVKISVRLLADAPATGIVSNSEVFGGDAASEAGETGWDLTWRYHVPSVADNNTNLYVLEEVVAVDGQPFTGTIVPSGHTVTYRISYYNTGNVPQHDVVLKTELPTQMTGTATFRHALGTSVLPASPASAGPGATVTFATIPVLNSGGGGAVLVDLVPSAASGTMVLNRATLESTEIPDPVYSNAPIIIGTRAFLVATETVTPASAKPGDTVHYTITVKNTGFSSATGLAITNWLPTANATTGNQQRFRFQTGTSVVTGLANVTPTVTAPTTVAPFDGVNRDQLRWAFNASTALASGATATITFDAKVGTSVARRAAPYLADLKVDYDDGANDTYAPAYNVAPVSVGASLSGTLFEDTGWTGGPGRSRGVAGGAAVGIPAARVELYDGAGAFVAATYSDGAGAYRFDGLS
ncbi:MAG: DUF11 domain-containing protein, partial [Myxococcales bacterium]|nr:DUF11 domain-containing protein [Myxococcales bacterium]